MSEQHIPDVTTSPILDKLLEFASFSASLQKLNNTDALWLCDIPTQDLVTASRQVTRQFADSTYNFCAIVNAKSGKCSEDCAWCAQSRRFRTAAPEYPLIRTEHVLQHARAVERAGIKRFSLVTSGRKLSPREVRETAEIVRNLKANTKLEICLSSGLLTKDELKLLHEAGVTRLHCNLESSAEFFPQVCTSHTSQDKIDTLLAARAVGMDLCSGGIIGMGESEADRIRLAVTLRNLQIPSIPINVLCPIPGTPLENQPALQTEELLRAVAIFRLINPRAYLRFAGGRARFSHNDQLLAMSAGINSAIAGDMLTTAGSAFKEDLDRVKKAGYRLEKDDPKTFDREHLWHPYAGTLTPPLTYRITGAKGVRIHLDNGQELIDGTSSWWCALFGYQHPKLVQAACSQAQTLSHVMFGGLTHDPAIELGQKLLRLVPAGLEKIFFCDSGSVAIEIAMKMAIQYQYACKRPKRTNFVTLRHGYHGDTWNAMSVCDPVSGMHTIFGKHLGSRYFIDSPTSRFDGSWNPADIDELRQCLSLHHEEIAALILEPIVQGASAMWFYHPRYLHEAAKLCRQYDILFIADEIATGFGRTGKTFACNWAEVAPDIMTIGKGLTGGMMTLAATLTTRHVADTISGTPPHALMHGPTFMANPLACRVACASLELFEQFDCETRVHAIEQHLKQALEELRGLPHVTDIRVCGAVGVVEIDHPVSLRELQPAFVQAGVWVRPFANLCYLMPPLVINPNDLKGLTDGFVHVMQSYLNK